MHSGRARRVELFVTGTNLTGQPVQYPDDFGGTLVDHEHRALFWFRHEPEVHASTFAHAGAPRRLASVARSTASFPGAFEASFAVSGTGRSRAGARRLPGSPRSSATHG